MVTAITSWVALDAPVASSAAALSAGPQDSPGLRVLVAQASAGNAIQRQLLEQ